MLKLRKEHLEAFEAHVVRRFATRAQAHLKAVWPAESGELGEAALAETLKGLIQRATALGFSTEYDVIRFVDLAFILGKDFETNPMAAWMRPILADRTVPPSARMDRLYQRMEEEFTLIEKRKGRKI